MTIAYEHILHARRMAVPFVGGAAQPSTSSLVNPAEGRERLNQHPKVGTRPRSFAANSCAATTAQITRLSWGFPLGGHQFSTLLAYLMEAGGTRERDGKWSGNGGNRRHDREGRRDEPACQADARQQVDQVKRQRFRHPLQPSADVSVDKVGNEQSTKCQKRTRDDADPSADCG